MERSIREFLKEIGREKLVARGVLKRVQRPDGETHELRGESIGPLQDLMREYNVTRLVGRDRKWFFEVDGEFANSLAWKPKHLGKEIKKGNVSQLYRKGNLFINQKDNINPFYKSNGHEVSDDSSGHEVSGDPPGPEVLQDSPSSFSLERDLQRTLRDNIKQLERGLRITDGGTERTVDAGRIDITAEDGGGNIVVIELKAGTARMASIGQILSYMGSIENPEEKGVRGILVAYDFDEQLEMAAKAVPNISLKAYSVQFTFEDRG